MKTTPLLMSLLLLSPNLACNESAATEGSADVEAEATPKPKPDVAEPAPSKPAATTCEDLADKLVKLYEPAGDLAVVKAKDVPEVVKKCTDRQTLTKQAEGVKCIMEATSIDGMSGACDGPKGHANRLLKSWMR